MQNLADMMAGGSKQQHLGKLSQEIYNTLQVNVDRSSETVNCCMTSTEIMCFVIDFIDVITLYQCFLRH